MQIDKTREAKRIAGDLSRASKLWKSYTKRWSTAQPETWLGNDAGTTYMQEHHYGNASMNVADMHQLHLPKRLRNRANSCKQTLTNQTSSINKRLRRLSRTGFKKQLTPCNFGVIFDVVWASQIDGKVTPQLHCFLKHSKQYNYAVMLQTESQNEPISTIFEN